MEKLKAYLKPWFQRVVWGILGSSHDNKHYLFSETRRSLLGKARFWRSKNSTSCRALSNHITASDRKTIGRNGSLDLQTQTGTKFPYGDKWGYLHK